MASISTRQKATRSLHRSRERLVSYRRIAVCLAPAESCTKAVGVACTLATEHGARIALIAAIEVPLEIPLDAVDSAINAAAREVLRKAQMIAEAYGVNSQAVLLYARDAGEAIVAELQTDHADVVLIISQRPAVGQRASAVPATTDYILKQAPCPVMLIAQPAGDGSGSFDPVFRAGHPSDYWPSGEFIDHIGRTSSRG